MNAPVTIDNVQARIAERKALETSRLDQVAECAAHLASVRRMVSDPMNSRLLWAEWHYYKALAEWAQTDVHNEWFDEACDNLGVNAEGVAA